ncbi:MAG: ABC transporter ATP-binding protein [Chloroflexi bacterium]|nr:ABC transporter ATP-binding protein [Chloroflexota bacterium]
MDWRTESERDTAIRLDDISVCYRVPHERIASLKEHTIRWLQRRTQTEQFLALREVTLDARRGEMIGIIGRNGAGKSTLLKVIARVLRPTTGRVRIAGAVAPLLEFGAGFHPELTGRENVFLNGALLGFSRAQMREKFDRIVDFAELWEFIDAPLRTFSSGMVARLGFAVATDVEPEILILDEVLSVGDAEFQRKSFERILSFRAAGATILFVSHNLDAVKSLCERAIWLEHGRVVSDGQAGAVVDQYQFGEGMKPRARGSIAPEQRWGTRRIEITDVRIKGDNGEEQAMFATSDSLKLEIDYCAHQPTAAPTFGIAIHRHDGMHITGPNTSFAGFPLPMLEGRGTVAFTIPHLPMLEGLYHISVSAHATDNPEMYDYHDRAYPFRIVNADGCRERYGLVTVRGNWSHIKQER